MKASHIDTATAPRLPGVTCGLLKPLLVSCVTAMLMSLAAPSLAAECAATIDTDDAMRFTPNHLDIPSSCVNFTVKLTHKGRLPVAAMGHNWVLVKAADLEGVARTGMLAGAGKSYIDPADRRVIAHTGLIGGGGDTSVTFAVNTLQAGQTYAFLCTFAGHSPLMQGTVSLTP